MPALSGSLQGFLYGLIGIRIFLLYLSTRISSNIMTQIYTERVLINGEEPPVLTHQIFLFIAIDFVMNLFLIAFVGALSMFMGNGDMSLLYLFLAQYLSSTGLLIVVGYILADIMYRRKYFLYKDDGLRSIRALSMALFQMGAVFSLVPMYMMMAAPLAELMLRIPKIPNAAPQIRNNTPLRNNAPLRNNVQVRNNA
jgi:hypothetical protein